MKVYIKSKDLLKLINPSEGILYKDQLINVDMNVLDEYVKFPKQKEIFKKTDDVLENFYKNAALYIINANEQKLIYIDLNNKNPLESGLFEYVTALYKKQETIAVSLTKEGDNLLFIKSKSLVEDKSISLGMAKDIEYAQLSSIFLETTKVVKKDLKPVDKDMFFWQEDGGDRFSSNTWIVENIKSFLKGNKYNRENSVEKNITDLLKKVNQEVITSDAFSIELLNFNDKFLNEIIINKYPKILKIDFNKEVFADKLMQDVKKSNFILLEMVLERNKMWKTDINPSIFENLLNQKESIDYLIEHRFYVNSPYDTSKKFGVVSCYDFLSEENKRNDKIISKYISSITGDRNDSSKYMVDELFYKLPLDILNDEKLLRSVIGQINIEELNEKLKKSGVENYLLSDKDFLISEASNLNVYKIGEILNSFHKNIDKPLIMELITQKPNFFSYIQNNSYYSCAKDIDVLIHAVDVGVKNNDIKADLVIPHLITNGTKEQEDFKLNQVISRQWLNLSSRNLYDSPQDRAKFKEKYNKLEYSFFNVDRYFNSNKQAGKLLQKIKSPQAIKELIKKMEKIPVEFEINYKEIYKNLHPNLKSDTTLLETTGMLESINFLDLPETLQYNKKIAIKFIAKDINHIPKEFFNDIDFSLKFASCLDSGEIDIKKAPDFISKFFTNQEVTSNYHEYLKTYISMSGLAQKLQEKEPVKIKIKI